MVFEMAGRITCYLDCGREPSTAEVFEHMNDVDISQYHPTHTSPCCFLRSTEIF
jgi:hypothetical protein